MKLIHLIIFEFKQIRKQQINHVTIKINKTKYFVSKLRYILFNKTLISICRVVFEIHWCNASLVQVEKQTIILSIMFCFFSDSKDSYRYAPKVCIFIKVLMPSVFSRLFSFESLSTLFPYSTWSSFVYLQITFDRTKILKTLTNFNYPTV